jgi:hypothetical protein
MTDRVPRELPDGMPGNGAASVHVGRLCRLAWDSLVG